MSSVRLAHLPVALGGSSRLTRRPQRSIHDLSIAGLLHMGHASAPLRQLCSASTTDPTAPDGARLAYNGRATRGSRGSGDQRRRAAKVRDVLRALDRAHLVVENAQHISEVSHAPAGSRPPPLPPKPLPLRTRQSDRGDTAAIGRRWTQLEIRSAPRTRNRQTSVATPVCRCHSRQISPGSRSTAPTLGEWK